MKAEQDLQAMIHATVSHELRNPLSSLLGQIEAMESFFDQFELVLESL